MAQYFNLTLDTTAPSNGVLSGLNAYYNSNATVTISADDAAFMKVWTNQTAVGTTSDAEIPSSWEAYNTSKTVSFSGQGTQYVHAMFMDNVGNIGVVVNSAATVFDNVAPSISAVSINNGDGFTRTTTGNTIRVTATDATSGITTLTLSGPISEAGDVTFTAEDRTAGYKDIEITFTGEDGTKQVSVTATDAAGNVSAAGSDTIVLDTTAAEGTLVLRNADDTANLAAYVNTRAYAAAIETQDTDIVGYKIYEGSEPSSWTSVTQDPSSPRILISNLELSAGDGTKTINAKIQDIAGNVTTLVAGTVVLDTTAPSVTLSAAPTVISAQTGFDSADFTITATDTNSAQGMSYEIKLGDTVIKTGTYDGNDITITEAEMTAISAGQGVKSFTAEVTDVAGNTGISGTQTVTVDLTAPTGSVTANELYNTQTVTVTVTGSDTGGATLTEMKVWIDDNEPANFEAFAAGTYTISNVAEGAHTAHLELKDSVGNVSAPFNSSEFIVDVTVPTGTITGPTYTNTASITLTITASDGDTSILRSGVDKMKVWETGTTEPSEWENFAASKSLTLTATDGAYTVSMKLKDEAGNESAAIVSGTINLDQDEPQGTIALFKTDDITVLPARVNTTGFYAHIAPTDATAPTPVSYRIYGDFAESMADGSWLEYTPDTGKQYKSISGTLNTPDGTKTINVIFMDAAGNTSTAVSATVVLDQSAPVIDVNAPDYNIVSKQHTLRLNAAGVEVEGKYNDMCTFTWSANEALQAFKVCVNAAEQTAAGAEAIGTTHGSQNMSGGSVEANTNITSVIMGADFAATDAVNETDGAYEVIVYGQDLAGTWSAVHSFNAGTGSESGSGSGSVNNEKEPFKDQNGNSFVLSNGDTFNVLSE